MVGSCSSQFASEKAYKASTDTAPLLPTKKQDNEQYDGYNAASFSSGVFSLSTSIVGAGIVGLPATMKTVGLIPGIILIVLVAFLTDVSIEFLLRYTSSSKAVTYGGVVADSFGRVGRVILQVCIVINNFGLLVVYLIIIADVLAGSASSNHSGVFEEWAGGQTWWNSRISVILFTSIFILAPLMSFRHVDSLRLSSALSVGLAIVFLLVTAAIAIYKLAAGTISMPRLFPEFDDDASTTLTYFSVLPVLATAYVYHHCMHPVLNELHDESQSTMVARTSLVLCTAIYVAISSFAYLLFGKATLSDVLSNFDADLEVPNGTILRDIVRVGYAVHLMLVFPVLNFALRLNIDGLIFPRAGPLSLDTRRFCTQTACIMIGAFLGALFIPDIWDAFQLTGSTSSVIIGFVFPGSLVLRDVVGIASKREKLIAVFMIVIAVGASAVALTGDIYDIFD